MLNKKFVDAQDQIENLKTYFIRVSQIINFIFRTVENLDNIKLSRKDNGINPLYNQIEANGGIALYTTKSYPCEIITPLGAIEVLDNPSKHADKLIEILTERLGLSLLKSNYDGSDQIYSITKDIRGESLPEAIMIPYQRRFIRYKEAQELWEKVKPAGLH